MSEGWIRVFFCIGGFVTGFGLLAFARNGYVERLEKKLAEMKR